MTTSSESFAEPEAAAIQEPHRSRHRSRHRLKIAARLVLVLGLVIAAVGISNFAYNAWGKADCYTGGGFDEGGVPTSGEPKSDACREEISGFDESQRLDAAALMLAVVLLTGSVIISRRIPKRRK
ncbi:MAG TPA: hypothetical protein VII29_11550 [Terriglobales bacterium]